jgi:hypothetical protein
MSNRQRSKVSKLKPTMKGRAQDDREGEENVTLDGTHGVEDQMVTGKSGLVCAQSGWALS